MTEGGVGLEKKNPGLGWGLLVLCSKDKHMTEFTQWKNVWILLSKVILGNCDTVCFSIKNKHQARFSGKRGHCSNWPCDICKLSTVVWLIPQSLVDHIHGRNKCQFPVTIRENPDVMLLSVAHRSPTSTDMLPLVVKESDLHDWVQDRA